MEDKRLFHRYPAGVRVAFRVSGEGFRGKVTDVSAGGGFVATDALPPIGSRLQMAAQQARGEPSIWLDLRVTWVNEEASESHPDPGFGGYWLHASCRYGEDPLRTFLAEVLGITRPVVRPMTPPAGGDAIFVYKFPDVYEREEQELPWATPRVKPDDRKVTKVRKVGKAAAKAAEKGKARKKSQASPRKAKKAGPPATFSQSTMAMLDEAPAMAGTPDSGLAALAALTQSEPVTVEHSSAGLSSPALDGPAAGVSDGEGRWSFLVRKLSGIRTGGGVPAEVSFGEGFNVRYKVGRKWAEARVEKIERSFVVLQPGGEVPEVWSRLLLQIPTEGRKSKQVEIHATVTRVKDGDVGDQVHCKINRVDEKGAPGAFSAYIEAFRQSVT
ncbi:MAG: hypothetical protein ACI9WU_004014 [Myxococcota bacterium]|jgi:hypothetical protein